MSSAEATPPRRTATDADWERWSTSIRVVVTDPAALEVAVEIVQAVLDDVELASSRFRPDSEVCLLAAAGGQPMRVSAVLQDLVETALEAARRTGGAVDPTLGNALLGLGYDTTISEIRPVHSVPPLPGGGTFTLSVRPARLWQRIRLDRTAGTVTVPDGVLLDLGATAKAWAADRAAALVALETGAGVLVSLGGDIATAGPGPAGGWQILVRDRPDDPAAQVALPSGMALATSSTQARRWGEEGREFHHVLDPANHVPVPDTWRSVSVAAMSCVEANTWSTDAIVAGSRAASRLAKAGVLARLLGSDRTIAYVGSWPREAEAAA
jgi:FAD:protein FMN transferase